MNAVPTLDHILRVALIYAAIFCTMAGAVVLSCVVTPGFVRRIADDGGHTRLASLRGLAILLGVGLAVAALRNSGVAGLAAGILVATPVAALWITGYAGVALRLGRAVLRLNGGGAPGDLWAALAGHGVLMTAVHVPVLGWAALGYAMLHGLGAAAGDSAAAAFSRLRRAPGDGDGAASRSAERG